MNIQKLNTLHSRKQYEPKVFNWTEEKVDLQELFLDSENHRLKIEQNTQLKTQKDIIDSLIKNDDILSLAKQISKYGFDLPWKSGAIVKESIRHKEGGQPCPGKGIVRKRLSSI